MHEGCEFWFDILIKLRGRLYYSRIVISSNKGKTKLMNKTISHA